ncbi:MAG: family 43 glycosylhydrolase, partial [Bifidobacteriaceae bacterium]|nr:family 43 glycosylhydrolase [Bifidobacteriaceae bacterium]
AAKTSSSFWLSATKTDGTALLAGLTEVTISYDSVAGDTATGWVFFADRTTAAPSYRNEHYIGVLDLPGSVTVERYNNSGQRIETGNAASTRADTGWKHVDAVFTASQTLLYLDGVLVGQNSGSVADLTAVLGASGGIFQIGKGNWESGEYNTGLVDNFQIYNRALTAAEISEIAWEREQAGLATFGLGDLSGVVRDIVLPATGPFGTPITWSSSEEGAIAVDGTVTRPGAGEADVDVTLTATLTHGEATVTKSFYATVLSLDAGTPAVVIDNLCLTQRTSYYATYYERPSGSNTKYPKLTCDGSNSTSWSNWQSAVAHTSDSLSYEFLEPYTLSQVTVRPTERAPLTLQVLYRDPTSRQWLPVQNPSTSPALANDTNSVVTFTPVTVTGVRLGMTFNSYGKIAEVVLGPAEVPEPADSDRVAADLAAISIPHTDDVRSNVTLPTTGPLYGSTITWESSNPAIVTDEADGDKAAGVVTRPPSGDASVTLTATASSGAASDSATFTLTVKQAATLAETTDYLFASFTGSESSITDEQIYFATSQDGAHFTDLTTAGAPALSSTIGDRGVRDPYLVRVPGGDRAYLIATDLSIYSRNGWGSGSRATESDFGSTQIAVWETTDMVNWDGPRLAELAGPIADAGMMWAPEAFWDDVTGQFYVYWATRSVSTNSLGDATNVYIASTRDFVTFSDPEPWIDRSNSVIDTTMIKIGDTYYRASADGQISIDKGSSVLGSWSSVSTLQSIFGNSNYSGSYLEGPEFFKYNTDDYPEGTYGLMADRYAAGTGYLPFRTTNVEDTTTASWAVASDVNFGALKKRHGTILPITATEYAAITEYYGVGGPEEPSGAELVASYDFSETSGMVLADSSGNGNDATVVGTPTWGDGQMVFSGDDYVQMPDGILSGYSEATIVVETAPAAATLTGNNFLWNIGGSATASPVQGQWFVHAPRPGTQIGLSGNTSATTANSGTALAADKWQSITATVKRNGATSLLSFYVDGQLRASASTANHLDSITAATSNFIGKSAWNDPNYQGVISSFKIYDKAMIASEVAEAAAEDAAVVAAELVSAVGGPLLTEEQVALPTYGGHVSWTSQDAAVQVSDGVNATVSLPTDGSARYALLTATATVRGETSSKVVTATLSAVTPGMALAVPAIVVEDLPSSVLGHTIEWSFTEAGHVAANGAVTLPASGSVSGTLTATIDGDEVLSAASSIAAPGGRIATYVKTGVDDLLAYPDDRRSDALFVAAQGAGDATWEALNRNQAILYVLWDGTQAANPNAQMGSPELFRFEDGHLGAVSSANNAGDGIYVWDADETSTFRGERFIELTSTSQVLHPHVVWDAAAQLYKVYWSDAGGGAHVTLLADLADGATPVVTITADPVVNAPVGTLPDGADPAQASYITLTESEYDAIYKKYVDLKNTALLTDLGQTLSVGEAMQALPAQVTLGYNDGSTKNLNVEWDATELAAVDTSTPGVYAVTGAVGQDDYAYPFVAGRADPHLFYNPDDEMYYLTASHYNQAYDGVVSQAQSYRKLALRRASTIEGLKTAQEHIIVDPDNVSGHTYGYSAFIWAPEFHKINGTWWVVVGMQSTWSTNGNYPNATVIIPFIGTVDDIKAGAMLDPAYWGAPVPLGTSANWDVSYYEIAGQGYWIIPNGGTMGFDVVKARMGSGQVPMPEGAVKEIYRIEAPYQYGKYDGTYSATNEGSDQGVIEGPYIVEHQGSLYLFYSMCTVDKYYAMGILRAEVGADIADPASWTAVPYPLLTSYDTADGQIGGAAQVGPGHNSVAIDEAGNLINVYHARPNPLPQAGQSGAGGLFDPSRSVALKSINVRADGTLDLAITADQEVAPQHKSVTAYIAVDAVLVESIAISGAGVASGALTLGVGDTRGLSATVLPVNATASSLTWTSDDQDVVTVDVLGQITAVGYGSARVTAAAQDSSGVSASIVVTVSEPVEDLLAAIVVPPVLAAGERLPTQVGDHKITWVVMAGTPTLAGSDGNVIASPPAAGLADLTLQAYIGSAGRLFEVKVIDSDHATLAGYTVTQTVRNTDDPDVELSVHLAVRPAGQGYTALNAGAGVIYAKGLNGSASNNVTKRNVDSPYLFRLADGGYGVIARRVQTSGTPATAD